jgi:hypothetical protein
VYYPPHIQKLVDSPKEVLTANQIHKIAGKDPNTLRYMARNMPERLPFPCIANPNESSVRFPKWPFLEAFGYKRDEANLPL